MTLIWSRSAVDFLVPVLHVRVWSSRFPSQLSGGN